MKLKFVDIVILVVDLEFSLKLVNDIVFGVQIVVFKFDLQIGGDIFVVLALVFLLDQFVLMFFVVDIEKLKGLELIFCLEDTLVLFFVSVLVFEFEGKLLIVK